MKYDDIVVYMVEMAIEDAAEFGIDPEEQLDYMLEELREGCEKRLQVICDPE